MTNQTTSRSTPPAICQHWTEQGGIYIGIARGEDGKPDAHLVLADIPYQTFEWQHGMDAAANLKHEGHADWRIPTRNESALLYANARDKVETGDWYWTSTKYSAGRAWSQDFFSGYQTRGYAEFEARVRFVRSVPL